MPTLNLIVMAIILNRFAASYPFGQCSSGEYSQRPPDDGIVAEEQMKPFQQENPRPLNSKSTTQSSIAEIITDRPMTTFPLEEPVNHISPSPLPIPSISNSTMDIGLGHHQIILPTNRPNKPYYQHPINRPPPTPPSNNSKKKEKVGLLYYFVRREVDGGYNFDFLAENSVFHQEQGSFKPNPENKTDLIHVKSGSYGFTSPEGVKFRVDYVADEKGYRAYENS